MNLMASQELMKTITSPGRIYKLRFGTADCVFSFFRGINSFKKARFETGLSRRLAWGTGHVMLNIYSRQWSQIGLSTFLACIRSASSPLGKFTVNIRWSLSFGLC